jgi:hypothetical protein
MLSYHHDIRTSFPSRFGKPESEAAGKAAAARRHPGRGGAPGEAVPRARRGDRPASSALARHANGFRIIKRSMAARGMPIIRRGSEIDRGQDSLGGQDSFRAQAKVDVRDDIGGQENLDGRRGETGFFL